MKYSQFLEVARGTEGFAKLQDYFVDYTGLKDVILEIERLSKSDAGDTELEASLRKKFMDRLQSDISEINAVSCKLLQQLEVGLSKAGGDATPAGNGTTVVEVGIDDIIASDGQEGTPDFQYHKARLVKQYFSLNSEAVRKIAKKYDKRAAGKNEQQRRVEELKTLAFGDSRIEDILSRIEKDMIARGKLLEGEDAISVDTQEGVNVSNAAAGDAGIVKKYLGVLTGVLTGALDGSNTFKPLDSDADKPLVKETTKDAIDKWALKEMKSSGKPWAEKNTQERVMTVFMLVAKLLLVAFLLYSFIISLSLMGGAFKVVGGKTSGRAFRQSELFANPVAGIVIGILATVLVQSSSTSTSIIITMTAADLISLKNSIPMIMGANIGTAVTASIVSVAHIGDRDQYRRAFGGAIVHYCFNILTVVILLPIEVAFGMLQHIASGIVDAAGITNEDDKGAKQDFLKVITKPVTSRLLQVDKKLVTKIAQESDPEKLAMLEKQSIIVQSQSKDNHLFMDTPMSDDVAGALLIIISLLLLSIVLMLLVKTLQSVFKGRAAIWLGKMLNMEIKRLPLAGDYILMLFGAGLTILMQSSSVTTSALTPLVGIGLIRVEKMFPFTIGANIGTTVTGILAALASSNMKIGMTVAMSHLLFNGFGTLIWFMVPIMRAVPLSMAKFLGSLAAEVKIFPVALILFAWVLIPGFLLLLCMGGVAVVGTIGTMVLIASVALIALIWMRSYYPEKLPRAFRRNFSWLPPTLCVGGDASQPSWNAGAAAATAASSVGDADMGSKGAWWQSVLAWGSGWFILMMLVMALPNCQWANLKYPKFDGRDHMGIGASQACSAMFEEGMSWAKPVSGCSQADLQACGTLARCSESGFSDEYGSNVDYEKAWVACRKNCALQEWSQFCLSQSCSGSLHQKQCNNVTEAVHQDFRVSHKATTDMAVAAGSRCRDVSDICDNGAALGNVGGFGWCGFAFSVLGQILLLAYRSVMAQRQGKVKILTASLGCFFFAWIMLLISWAMFASLSRSETSCIVMDASATGAVVAHGPFGDIIKGWGSYSYAITVASWMLTTLVVGVLVHHLAAEVKKPKKSDIASESL